jgi:endoglucanase
VVLVLLLCRYEGAYRAAGQLDTMRDTIRWPLDYFMRAHTKPRELYVQVSDAVDHCLWLPPQAETYKRCVEVNPSL